MDRLVFQPEPFGGSRFAGRATDGCGCDACRTGELDDEPELDDDDALGEICPRYVHAFGEPELEAEATGLVDYVMNRASGTRSYGKKTAGPYAGQQTSNRCLDGKHDCPKIDKLEVVTQIDGIPFEYIGGWDGAPGLLWGKTTKKWLVWESHRRKQRKAYFLPRVGDGLVAFIANMKAAGMPIEAILTMGSLVCRCISNSARLSPHSFGDAIDIGGVRLVGGREILAANSECVAEDRKALHRINACLRLSFARVFDYHDRLPKPTHWDHFHCDTNFGGERKAPGRKPKYFHLWGFIRESLGLPWRGGRDKACEAALIEFGGPQALKDLPATLGKLFLREALAEPPDREPRYSCHYPLKSKARPG